MKHLNKITAAVLMIFILFFSLSTIMKMESAESMKITWQSFIDGSFISQLNTFTADYFKARNILISAETRIKSAIGESLVNGVYISESRLLKADVLSKRNIDNSADVLNEFSEKYEGAVYLVSVPTSSGVYGDMLPSYLPGKTEKQQIDSLYEKLDSEIRKIDAYNILKMLSDNYIYYRSDTKWTSYGAFCVYRTVIQKLGFMPLSYDKYTIQHITNSYQGNLYSETQYMKSSGDLLDIYEYDSGAEIKSCIGYDNNGISFHCSLYDKEAMKSGDMYRLYLGKKYPLVKISTDVNNDKKLLVVGDDFASCFIPFLTQHYSEIAFVSPECMEKNLRSFLNPNDYGQTLFLLGIDSLSNNILENF